MSFSINHVFKNIHIAAAIYFIFFKKFPRSNLKGSQYQIWTLQKHYKSSYQARQTLTLFCKSVAPLTG